MGASSSHQPVMVAAIDFGTTYSGYAFAFNKEPDNIILNKNWGSELGIASLKTPTSVLVNEKREFVSFGYKAESEYARLCREENAQLYELYRNFKMTLYTDKDLRKSTMVRSVRGKEFSLMKLTEFTLRFLQQHLLDVVNKSTTQLVNRNIQWVLTVPAIWHEDAKQFMRESAFKAGLIEDQYSDQLILALEPEAASVFCRGLDVRDFNEELSIKTEDFKFEIGTNYLIADIGGGTLDITAHEIQDKHKLVEIIIANGGDLGGLKLNDNFESLLKDIFGEFVEHLQENYPHLWLELMIQYETKKRGVTAYCNENIYIDINSFIIQEFKNYTGKQIEDVIKELDRPGLAYCRGKIKIQQVTLKKLFEPVVGIKSCIQETLENEAITDLKYLIVVGGFSNSSYLLREIEKAFKNIFFRIISPAAANSVILKGAVLFGQNPSTIHSRKCRKTYGIGIDEVGLSREVFKPYVLKGEQVDVNTYKTYTFTTTETDINISIYCTDRVDVKYTDEEGVTKLHDLSLQDSCSGSFMRLFSSSGRKIESRIYFGETEITVELQDKKTRQTVRAPINFLKE